MIWVVDKQTVRHLLEHQGVMAEVPVRVSFEYALEGCELVAGSLSLKTLYNQPCVCRSFPGLDQEEIEQQVQQTVNRAIDEHLALCGYRGIEAAHEPA